MDTAIESDCLYKVYRGGNVGLIDFSLQVAPGEILGLLGPGGAGKSTLLRLIAGDIPPTAGHLRIQGHDCVAEREAARSAVGALFDATGRSASRRGLAAGRCSSWMSRRCPETGPAGRRSERSCESWRGPAVEP